ncbi:hypothetical protein EVAR_31049_1 [Eumeta japonica]|uniref:Uncharacterized protein n=1 Tax=Eumeta variegata TaxID=151549 RepID=A0A4C1VDW5_EUMVA|nr:hypothetical protein EVAR_31049_1 [Eumeta japonica]
MSTSDTHQNCSSRVTWVPERGSICKEVRSNCKLNSYPQRWVREYCRSTREYCLYRSGSMIMLHRPPPPHVAGLPPTVVVNSIYNDVKISIARPGMVAYSKTIIEDIRLRTEVAAFAVAFRSVTRSSTSPHPLPSTKSPPLDALFPPELPATQSFKVVNVHRRR